MENATKALLIAAGVFFGIMILSTCIFAYTQITEYYRNEEKEDLIKQTIKFNNEYEAYIRNNVRGNEILSLINKVVDYNKREADMPGIRFQRMILSIDFDGKENEFKYSKDYGLKPETIIKSCNNNSNDSDLYKISNAVTNIQQYSGYTEKQLQGLAKNISNIFAPDEYTAGNKKLVSYQSAVKKRNSVIKEILGVEYDSITDKNSLKKAALEYYQYQQLKRAHFDCIESQVTYNKQTGRIVKLSFKFNGKFE